jgi:hypothetical protein
MPRHHKKLKLKLEIAQNCILETFFRNKIYLPNATPALTQIVIQKIGAVIFPKHKFFLKLVTCLTQVRKGKKTTLKLECLIFSLKK